MRYPQIEALASDVADKIAAGEVVERPLSIVKELLENSIDAGATSITVETSKGGKEYIRVTDNGCGIPRDQLELAFMRYATSKLRTAEDLSAVDTLGFRGEALASIASVSRTELISRPASEKLGARISIAASSILSIEDAACEDGTTIIVRDLFYNVPARLKFLKPDNTEAALITDYVSKMAIAYPAVRIRLISNGTTLFSSPGKGSLKHALMTVYSPKMCEKLLELAREEEGMRLTGYISSPTYFERNRRRQIFFVNGRLIKSKLLENAVARAYSDKLFDGQYPAVFLFLNIDPSELDVNIHPHKTEVRFYQEGPVSDFIVNAIRRTLLDPRSLELKAPSYEAHVPEVREVRPAAEEVEKVYLFEPEIKEEHPEPSAAASFFSAQRAQQTEKEVQVQEEIFEYNTDKRLIFASLEYIGEIFATYLLFKDDSGLYIMDQHAAHERVMYEKLLKGFNSEENASQQLLVPMIKELGISEVQAAADAAVLLKDLGFEIREFGPTAYAVSAVPGFMDLAEAESFIDEFFSASSEGRSVQARRDQITMRACKSAVKAHDKLSVSEIRRLLLDLDRCENPFSCPHGRPVFLKYSEYELERLFKRK